MKKISVLLSVKDGENFISKTIDSILEQTYKNIELIVIVNCSKDKTLDIVKSYEDTRVKVFESNICQLNFNLNLALLNSTGEYIARIDADDVCVKERFEKQVAILEKSNLDLVGSNIEYIDENDNFKGLRKYPETNEEIRNKIFYKAVLVHPSILCKKNILLDVGGYLGGRFAQDYDLWLRIMRNKNIKFYNIQESLIKYRIHSNQTKGNSMSYADVAGYLFRESLYSKSFKYFIGSFIYYIKALIK